MKVKRGQRNVKFGPGQLTGGLLVQSNHLYRIMLISEKNMHDLIIKQPEVYGSPVYISQSSIVKASLWPLPDKASEIKVQWISYHEV